MKTVTDKYGDIRTYNDKGQLIHCKYTDKMEISWEYHENGEAKVIGCNNGYREEYDTNGNCIHIKEANGDEYWLDDNGKEIPNPNKG
jgi:hypothetical protein